MNDEINREEKLWELYTTTESTKKEVFDTATEHKDTYRAEVDSLDATKRESQEIAKILGDQSMKLDDEVRLSLEARQGRDLSHILINSKKLFGDSKEMKEVKAALRALENALAVERNADTVITAEEIEEVENKYVSAIDVCSYYLSVKTTITRSDRNNMVRERLKGLMDEYSRITRMKQIITENPTAEVGKVNCVYALLLGSKLLEIKSDKRIVTSKKADEPVLRDKEALKVFREDEAGFNAQDTVTKEIIDILTLTKQPSEFVNKKDDDAGQIAQGIFNLLKAFPEGVHAQYIHTGIFMTNGKRKWKNAEDKEEFCRTVIGIMQDKTGTLTVKIGNVNFELPYGKDAILSHMQDNMLANSEKFNSQFLVDNLDWVREADLEKESTVEIRTLCVKLIERKTGIAATEFNNITTESIRSMMFQLLEGTIDKEGIEQCIDVAERFAVTTDAAGNETVVRGTVTERMVNGGETMEILRYRERRMAELRTEVLSQIGPNLMEDIKKQLLKQRLDAIKGSTVVKVESTVRKIGRLGDWIVGAAEKVAKDVIDRLIIDAIGVEAFNELMRAVELEVNKEVEEEINRRIKAELKEVVFDTVERTEEPVEEEEEDQWTQDEAAIKNLVADIIFSKDTWKADETVEAPGVRIERILYDNSKLLMKIAKNPGIIDDMIDKLPIPGMKNRIKAKLNALLGEITSHKGIAEAITKRLSDDLINLVIKSALSVSKVKSEIVALEEEINSAFAEGTAAVQLEINRCVDTLFGSGNGTAAADPVIGDPNEPGITEQQKADRIKAGRDLLNSKIQDATSGDSGQALFIKNVFRTYFTNVPLMDQRAMLSAAIRDMTPATADLAGLASLGEDATLTEEQKMHIAGKFLGGIFKGAGPLMQKILQGIPADSMPKELKDAFEDVKSNLLPIPQEIVEAQLMSMVERSKGEVKKIEVVKVLGAASVGQAFLCKMFGPSLPEDGKKVVVKILRPNVRNRMKREEAIMLRCASDTNEGMMKTYNGQLERIREELDLTVEAANVQRGQIYSRGSEADHVTAMKLETLIAPTVNSMVIECSPGQTVDKYLKETKAEIDQLMKEFEVVTRKSNGEKNVSYVTTDRPAADVKKARIIISKKIAELQKRQVYLLNLSKKWVEEGLFGEGFYHGDLHAGNIMIDDDGATVIDFGNATQLTAEQKDIVTQMMAAAVVGEVEVFRDGYHELMKKDEATEEHFARTVSAFDLELGKIFKLGDMNSSGQRIAAALLKAQELGLELPAAIYNFSQCQIRLQNTVDSFNKEITDLQSMMGSLSDATASLSGVARPLTAIEKMNHVHPESTLIHYNLMMGTVVKSMTQEEFLSDLYSMGEEEFDKYFLLDGKFKNKIGEKYGTPDLYSIIMRGYSGNVSERDLISQIMTMTVANTPFKARMKALELTIGTDNYARLLELVKKPVQNKDEILLILANYRTLPAMIQELKDMRKDGESEEDIKDKEKQIFDIYKSLMESETPATTNGFTESKMDTIIQKGINLLIADGVREEQIRKQFEFVIKDPANEQIFEEVMAKRTIYLAAVKETKTISSRLRRLNTEVATEPERVADRDAAQAALTQKQSVEAELKAALMKSIKGLYVVANRISMKELYEAKAKFVREHPGKGMEPGMGNLGNETSYSTKKLGDFIDVMGEVLTSHTKETLKRLGLKFIFKHYKEMQELG